MRERCAEPPSDPAPLHGSSVWAGDRRIAQPAVHDDAVNVLSSA